MSTIIGHWYEVNDTRIGFAINRNFIALHYLLDRLTNITQTNIDTSSL